MGKPYRLDVLAENGGLLVFVNKDINSKCVQIFRLPEHIGR